ncbi:magnesium transporter CorA [Hydrogenophaga crassostreae]|uniref:Magnesium transporter CorA n=1 Tax=Hydrogenophaga crassostreae TaxID=1763535 RepID=A0A167GU38_9BURK|nr:magnesium transporter CorA family protein [Hydrogenophaga crassostreae]AOW11791.1 magnesium transporter CorA [Hydrogenophaga crassostreae]OAD39884.1 magnesium transporter CorA [Hydrogenophaga crassostreae]
MRCFHIQPKGVTELADPPHQAPASGFVWIACGRQELEAEQAQVQTALSDLSGHTLVDLHISDLLNKQLPSHFDYTSDYDLLVFRRLATSQTENGIAEPAQSLAQRPKRSGPPVLRQIDTSPVGFAVFDRVVLTVHPAGCAVLDHYAQRLLTAPSANNRSPGAHLPASPADLMLRVVHHMVDGYLDLRRELTRQLDHWQTELLKPRARFQNWSTLLEARISLHQLDDICEDQRSAVLDWIESLASWEADDHNGGLRGLELLRVRSRDVLEHIERVVHHVRRLEQNAETAVQMHFSAQSNRTNDIMRTLTVLTAVFLPLNLIAGIFGMNFQFIPLVHQQEGFWWAMGAMVVIAVGLSVFFWRHRYLERSSR